MRQPEDSEIWDCGLASRTLGDEWAAQYGTSHHVSFNENPVILSGPHWMNPNRASEVSSPTELYGGNAQVGMVWFGFVSFACFVFLSYDSLMKLSQNDFKCTLWNTWDYKGHWLYLNMVPPVTPRHVLKQNQSVVLSIVFEIELSEVLWVCLCSHLKVFALWNLVWWALHWAADRDGGNNLSHVYAAYNT